MSYRIGIDVGGTFTDFLLADGAAPVRDYKRLTTPDDPSAGLVQGLAELARELGIAAPDFISHLQLIVHGTTTATNTVITLSGARTALLTTQGFRDALDMRRGTKDRIYDPKYPHPTPLAPRYLRLGVEERQDYLGQQVAAVDAAQLRERCAFLRAEAVEAVALCFMHAYANDQNEAVAAEIIAAELPGVYLAVSSRLLPRIDFYRRTSTTVLDAYVGPKMARYFARLLSRLGDAGFRGKLLVMQSNGGVIAPDLPTAAPVRTLLSGPAAGTVAGAAFARQLDYGDCISLDMGGTSLDAALIMGGEPLIVGDGKLNRYDVAVPMVDIHSIGAGGGSIGWVDSGGLLHVGPQSAGAQPGPACYGFGGQLPTCTDANLLLGYLNADYFLGGRMPLDAAAARQAVEAHVARPLGLSVEAAAAGMFELVNVNMAAGVRHVSLNRGYDPRDFPLVVAGGAGPIHAAMIAAELRIPVVIIPRASSTFSATGLLLADLKHDHIRTYAVPCDQLDRQRVAALFAEMERAGTDALASEGVSAAAMECRFSADMRYVGQYHEIEVPLERAQVQPIDVGAWVARFVERHDRQFGYTLGEQPVEVINLRLTALGRANSVQFPRESTAAGALAEVRKGRRAVYLPAERTTEAVDVYDGERVRSGARLAGPAIVEWPTTSIFVPPAYRAVCDRYRNFVLCTADREGEVLERALGTGGPPIG